MNDTTPEPTQEPAQEYPATPATPQPQPADDTPAEAGDDTGVDGDEQADEFVGED